MELKRKKLTALEKVAKEAREAAQAERVKERKGATYKLRGRVTIRTR